MSHARELISKAWLTYFTECISKVIDGFQFWCRIPY